jgi:hypothetical protein
MAKLIVSRTRQFADRLRRYRILIDGDRVASIGPGNTVESDLTPGRHRVTARLDFMSTPPVEIETAPEGIRHLRVGSNLVYSTSLKLVMVLPVLAPFWILFINLAYSRLFGDPFEAGWFSQFMIPSVFLPFLLQIAFMVICRDRFLYLQEIPALDPGTRQVALPRVQPVGIRVTIRGMMIAIAILAILLGVWIEWGRHTRRDFFSNRASRDAVWETTFRQLEKVWSRMADQTQKAGLNAGPARQAAAKAAKKADYHAAMKRKYEAAASRRWFFVEPDPPEPPWP